MKRSAVCSFVVTFVIFNSVTSFSAYSQTTIPSSNQTVVLQTLKPGESSFILPIASTISTVSGDGIDGNNSRNWQLLIQGVVNAAGNGISLSSLNETGTQINNYGTITGNNGTAILLNSSNSTITLNSGSIINGNILSNAANNRLVLNGSGSTQGSFSGNNGFSNFIVNADPLTTQTLGWKTGNILLSGTSMSSGSINSGLLVTTGTITATNSSAGITIAPNAFLQVGTGGTTGEIDVPVQVNGTLIFFLSTAPLSLQTLVSGSGVLFLRGTGVNGQSSYVLNAQSDSFTGNIIIGSGARIQSTDTTPPPLAHVYVSDGGTLWLGSTATYTAPIYIQGNGWHEADGSQYGALRLDSNPVQAGPVTLLGNAEITAIFNGYFGTISGDINDGGNGFTLIKTGGGQITLSGNNSYSGGTVISAGTLAVSNDFNLGASSAPLTMGADSTLLMTNGFNSSRPLIFSSGTGNLSTSSDNIFNGDISGSGQAVIQQGNITFAGSDSHTGGTTINSGARLQIGSGAASGTLNGPLLNNGTLAFNRAGTSIYSGTLSGAGTLIKQGSGTVTLSGSGSNQSNVQVNAGTLAFAPAGTFTANGNLSTADNATTSVATGSVLQVNGILQQSALANLNVSLNMTQPAVVATQIVLNGALTLSGAITSASEAASKTLTALHSTTTSGITGDFTSLGFSNSADYLSVSGAKTNSDTNYLLSFGLRWLAGPTMANGVFTLNNTADTFNVDVVLGDQTGPFTSGWDGKTLTKAGLGMLTLSQQNSYDGATLINSGTLQTSVADAFASSSAVSIASAGTLALNNFDQHVNNLSGAGNIVLGSASLTAINNVPTQFSGAIGGTGSLTKQGAETLTLSGNSSYSGGTQLNDGTLIATNGGVFGTGTVNNASLLNLDFSNNSVMNNLLTGPGTLLKTGPGIAVLTAANSTVGNVETQQGALLLAQNGRFNTTGNFVTDVGSTTAIGPHSSVNTGSLFDMKGSLSLLVGGIEPVVQATQIALGSLSMLNIAGLVAPVNATETQLAENSYEVMGAGSPGGINGAFDTLLIGGATSPVDYATVTGYTDLLHQRYNIGIRLNWYAQYSDTPDVANGVFALINRNEEFNLLAPLVDQNANTLTGWDGKTLTKAGDGTLILSGHNLYTGATLINGGTLQTGIADAFINCSGVAIASDATLALDGFSQHITQLSGSGEVNLGSATLSLNNAADNLFSGQISGNGNVAKSGNGTLYLSSDATYTGVTDVNQGALALGSGGQPINLASSQVNIASGATLGGYGNVAGNVNNQGILAVADALPVYNGGMTGNLTLGGNLVNSGNIIMASTQPASTLTVNGNYTGNNGLLTLSTVLGGDNSATDKLVILGNSAGSTRVQINNAGGKGAATTQGIEVISVAGQSDGIFTQQNRVVAGAYDYFLQKSTTNGNWYLLSQTPEPPLPPQDPVIRPEAGSYIANLAAARMLFNQQLEDRAGHAENSTFWLRQSGGHTGFYDDSGQLKTTTNSYVVQGGSELLSGQFGVKDHLGIGVMAGYGNAQSNTNSNSSNYQSKGKVEGYSSGLYATWYQNANTQEGVYVDSWLQYNWLNATVDGEQLASEGYNINGFNGSIESGYRLPVYQGENGNVFITPQAQLIWEGLTADTHTESNGTAVSSSDDNNLLSRLGIKISRDGVAKQDSNSDKLFITYIAANWLHNTDPVGINFDGENVKQAGTANIAEIKLGVEGKLNTKLNVWTNVGQQIGGDGYSNLSAIIGVNYQF